MTAPPDPGRVAHPAPIEPAALLRLLQLADSAFPTGAFAFSHGLEGLLDLGLLRGEADVAAVLRVHVEESLAGLEAPAARHAHRAAAAADLAALLRLDAELAARKPVPAFRAASARTGRRFLASTSGLVDGPTLGSFRGAVAAGLADGHHALAFAVVLEAAGLDEETTALTLAAGFLGNLAAAAVHLGTIGQTAAQRLVAALRPDLLAAVEHARAVPIAEMGAYAPLLDLAGLRQPALQGRLFGS